MLGNFPLDDQDEDREHDGHTTYIASSTVTESLQPLHTVIHERPSLAEAIVQVSLQTLLIPQMLLYMATDLLDLCHVVAQRVYLFVLVCGERPYGAAGP